MRSVLKPIFEYNLKPNKYLGQNFLADPSTADMIVKRAKLGSEDIVLEIGAGIGGLTFPLSSVVKKVYAVEKDTRLVSLLGEEILKRGVSNIELFDNDILSFDIRRLYETEKKNIVVIGNLPYKISSQIIVKLIDEREIIEKAVVMLQKELIHRLIAEPKTRDYGRLTVMLNYCSIVDKLCEVKSNLFYPKPKVDSAVIKIDFLKEPHIKADDEKFLFSVVKAAFAQRRKNLKNSLSGSGILDIEPDNCITALQNAGIDHTRRAETLSIEEFVILSDILFDLKNEVKHNTN